MNENRAVLASSAETTASRVSEPYSNAFCGYCGERLVVSGEALQACPACGARFRDARPTRRDAWYPPPASGGRHREPVLAAILSTVLPGSGQVYNGQFFKGLFVFCTCWLVIPWLFGILDAYVTARRPV
ncbi:MAG: hypothetical protein AB1486_07520 [Planctomycetota bacterium]